MCACACVSKLRNTKRERKKISILYFIKNFNNTINIYVIYFKLRLLSNFFPNYRENTYINLHLWQFDRSDKKCIRKIAFAHQNAFQPLQWKSRRKRSTFSNTIERERWIIQHSDKLIYISNFSFIRLFTLSFLLYIKCINYN